MGLVLRLGQVLRVVLVGLVLPVVRSIQHHRLDLLGLGAHVDHAVLDGQLAVPNRDPSNMKLILCQFSIIFLPSLPAIQQVQVVQLRKKYSKLMINYFIF